MTHIPASNPFVSKLAGMAVRVVEGFDCEVIVGSYYEPYGLAASLAASWTGTRVLLEHAGSDLDRLMRLPELAAAYKPMLRAADGVITRPGLARRFIGMGVRPEALLMGSPYGMPDVFTPAAPPLRAGDIERLAFQRPERAFDPSLPTIGMYGKPGPQKGTYDLIAALGMLRAAGLDFNLLMLNGPGHGEVGAAIARTGLADRTWLLHFLPHWRVPSFIRACTAVCFLERDFPVTIHGPVIAREVLTCGTCLVLSGEIHGKQSNKDELTDGDNLVLVPDPKDRETLAKQLRAVIGDPANAAEIGARGRLTTTAFPSFDAFVDSWEALTAGTAEGGLGRGTGSVTDRLAATLPWASPLLGASFDELTSTFPDAGGLLPADEDDPALAARFCDFAAGKLTGALRDVARYERARLWAMRDDVTEPPIRPTGNALGGREPSTEAMSRLYPFRCVPVWVERFAHDVRPALCRTDEPEVADAADIALRPTVIGFARMPNLSPTEFHLNEATVRLLECCTGDTRADLLVAAVIAKLVPTTGAPGTDMTEQAFAILAELYGAGVIAFAASATQAAPLTYGQ